MASAPKPGVGRRHEEAVAAQQILVITIGDDEWRLAWRNLPLGERLLVRKWTGLTYAHFIATGDTIDGDSLALLWCLARRAAGETSLLFGEPLVDEWEERTGGIAGGVDVRVEEPDGTDPEV